ncbi:MAG TPA: glucoamylase family protein, partial [Flavitalea sp.]|nr:glucoamylase family protein [Flavitalea sp.]
MTIIRLLLVIVVATGFCGCSKSGSSNEPVPVPKQLTVKHWAVGSIANQEKYQDVPVNSSIRYEFSTPLDKESATAGISLKSASGSSIPLAFTFLDGDSVLDISPSLPLDNLSLYDVELSTELKSKAGSRLQVPASISLLTSIDSSDKFPRVSDEELLTIIQRQTFNFFWDFGHAASGMARERDNSGDLVTTGGTGFGVMAMLVGIHRNFITRQEGVERVKKITDFLTSKADRFHGAFPHWLSGATGKVISFSENDNGADLVETSLLLQGLLTARQFFNGTDPVETALRNSITTIYNSVEWTAFVPAGSNELFWHLSPTSEFIMNMPVRGWNEALICYVLAASSPTYPISKAVYENGWASNGAIKNGNSYYDVTLPLGPSQGGPLFFSHYSFLGLDPTGLTDQYADYLQQVKAHSTIHYKYAQANPGRFFGYGPSVWGLTASDDNELAYLAHSPSNDDGVVAPTAAVSSIPFTPVQSMAAIRFYYYTLGDRLFGQYGFMDAFSLEDSWFSNSYLAIDQGPMIIMIENFRSGLLWDLFMSNPE